MLTKMASPTNNWLSPILVTSHTIGLTTTTTTTTVQQWSVPRISIESQLCDVRGSPVGGVERKVRFVTLILIVVFIAFLEQGLREQHFWRENCKKIPYIEGENKYLFFVGYHLARSENGWWKLQSGDKMDSGCFYYTVEKSDLLAGKKKWFPE